MTIRDRITRVRARTPSVEDYPASMAVHRRLTGPTLCGTFGNTHGRRQQTNPWPAYAGSRLKLSDALGRHRRKCQPSSRTGENPPYGMIGGIEETSASCEARSAPRPYQTARNPRAYRDPSESVATLDRGPRLVDHVTLSELGCIDESF